MNLKKTTKDKLYAMLCEEQKKRAEAEEIMRKQAENAHTLQQSYEQLERDSLKRLDQKNDELAKCVEEKSALAEELHEVYENKARLEAAFEVLHRTNRELRDELNECYVKKIWSEEHPWRHLWKCLWRA